MARQLYDPPEREGLPNALPNVEVFEVTAAEIEPGSAFVEFGPGWFYWFCFPGCLPDSEPFGPFENEAAAIDDLRAGWEG